MSNWQTKKLGEVADVKLSNVDKKTKPDERVVRLCNYTDVYKNSFINSDKVEDFMIASCNENEFEKFVLKKGQVAITKDSEKRDDIGISTYISENFDDVVLGYHLSLITPYENELDGRFLHYWFNTKQAKTYFENNAGGSGQRCTLPIDIIKSVPLKLPDFPTQQKIASILSALDDKIELNNKINDNLEQQAKTLYDYWFVQNANPKWEIVTLNNFIKSDKSGDWGKEEGQGNYITRVECIRGADINGIIGKGEMKTPTRFILEKNRNKILSENDLVIEISGGSPTQSTGRLAYITTEVLERFENPLICSNFCKAISLNNPNELFYFVYSWNKAYENNVFFGFEGKTSGIKNLLFETLVSTYSIVKPDEKTLIEFQKVISTLEKQRQKNLQQNQQLSQLRDWLLPMLMNGQVKVE